ncbi:hypothetical protein Fcan01_06475 [Folsomia candida]|uniref:Uncharacterized protein n=1 Tax=Folsomia candida TaxID=158441 RepID=A0A226EMK1_FOLCA|nr:hypothetical protein Fcan01_06475 [Folsomia candida]
MVNQKFFAFTFLYNLLICNTIRSNPGNQFAISSIQQFFSSCTNFLITPNSTVISALRFDISPIVLTNELDGKRQPTIGTNAKTTQKRFSLHKNSNQRGRNCWAFFLILPENDISFPEIYNNTLENFITEFKRYFLMKSSSFIGKDTLPQYFIWFTSLADEFQTWLTKSTMHKVGLFGVREFFVVHVRLDLHTGFVYIDREGENGQLFLHYHNRHYCSVTILISKPWYTIPCHSDEISTCDNTKLDSITQFVANLNRYFWDFESWIISLNNDKILNLQNKYTFLRPVDSYDDIVTFITFDEFLGFWLLHDILPQLNMTDPGQQLGRNYILGQKHELKFNPEANIILEGVELFSWLSCHGVNMDNSTPLSELVSPFDWRTWILLWIILFVGISLLSVVIPIQGGASSDKISTTCQLSWFISIGILLECSVFGVYLKSFVNRRSTCGIMSAYIILAFLAILFGTVLTNWYKSSFTMEMIVPPRFTAPWRSVADLAGFTVIVPMEAILNSFELKLTDDSIHPMFYSMIQSKLKKRMEYVGTSRVLKEYRDFAWTLYYGGNKSTTSTNQFGQEFVKPVKYSETIQFVNNLSTCDRVAYMDLKENVINLLPFLNDNRKQVTFLKGDDGFFTSFLGWKEYPVRNSYVWKRLKVMMSSGIYAHWKRWFGLIKPVSIFPHWVNWTYPIVSMEARLDLSSKISTGFCAFGIGVLVSTLAMWGEALYAKWK